MYEIRQASGPSEAELIRELAIEYTAVLEEPIDANHYVNNWRAFLETGVGVVFFLGHDGAVVGGIGAIQVPGFLSGRIELIELFWYVTPKHRRAGVLLYAKMEEYFLSTPTLHRFAMIHMEKSMPEKLKSFYLKKGFELVETHWVKKKPEAV